MKKTLLNMTLAFAGLNAHAATPLCQGLSREEMKAQAEKLDAASDELWKLMRAFEKSKEKAAYTIVDKAFSYIIFESAECKVMIDEGEYR